MTATPNNAPGPEPLSPAAQAVLDAVVSQPTYATRKRIAAALCAIADQVVPEEPYCHEDDLMSEYIRRSQRQETRTKFLAIATELENHQ